MSNLKRLNFKINNSWRENKYFLDQLIELSSHKNPSIPDNFTPTLPSRSIKLRGIILKRLDTGIAIMIKKINLQLRQAQVIRQPLKEVLGLTL